MGRIRCLGVKVVRAWARCEPAISAVVATHAHPHCAFNKFQYTKKVLSKDGDANKPVVFGCK